jgi:hypothetical protein
LVREALKARYMLENAGLDSKCDLSLLNAARHLKKHYKKKEQSYTYEEVYKKSVRARKKKRGKWSTSYTRDQDCLMKGPKPHPKASEEDRDKEND